MTHKAGRSDHGDQLALSGRPVRHTILNKSVPYFRALRSTTRLGESLRVEDAISEPCSDSHDMGKHPLDPAIGHLRVWHEQCSFANGPARGHLTWVRRRHKCATLTLSVRLRGSRPAAELSWALAKGESRMQPQKVRARSSQRPRRRPEGSTGMASSSAPRRATAATAPLAPCACLGLRRVSVLGLPAAAPPEASERRSQRIARGEAAEGSGQVSRL